MQFYKDPGNKQSSKFKGCEETIDFTKKMNELFDLLNNHEKKKSITSTDCPAYKVSFLRIIHFY